MRHLSQSLNRASVFNGVLRKKTISCCEIISFPVRMSQDSDQITSLSTAKATSSTHRPETCTKAATKYYNYIVNETDEEIDCSQSPIFS